MAQCQQENGVFLSLIDRFTDTENKTNTGLLIVKHSNKLPLQLKSDY